MEPTYDGALGTAGGAAFGAALQALASGEGLDGAALADKAGLPADLVAAFSPARSGWRFRRWPGWPGRCGWSDRIHAEDRTALARGLRESGSTRCIFLPEGPIRYEARIYMRESTRAMRCRKGTCSSAIRF